MANEVELMEITPETIKYDSRISRFLKKGVLPKLGSGSLISVGAFVLLAGGAIATGGLSLAAGAVTAGIVAGSIAGTAVTAGAVVQTVYSGAYYKSRLAKSRFDALGLERSIEIINNQEEDLQEFRQALKDLEGTGEKTITLKSGEKLNKRQLTSRIKEYEDITHHALRYIYDVGLECSKKINYFGTKTSLKPDEELARDRYKKQLEAISACTKNVCSHFTEGTNPYKELMVRTLRNGCLLGNEEQNREIRNLNQYPDKSRAMVLFHEMYEKEALQGRKDALDEFKKRQDEAYANSKANQQKYNDLIEQAEAYLNLTGVLSAGDIKTLGIKINALKQAQDAIRVALNADDINARVTDADVVYDDLKSFVETIVNSMKNVRNDARKEGASQLQIVKNAKNELDIYNRYAKQLSKLAITLEPSLVELVTEIQLMVDGYTNGLAIDFTELNAKVIELNKANKKLVNILSKNKSQQNIQALKTKAQSLIDRFKIVSAPNTKYKISAEQQDAIDKLQGIINKPILSEVEVQTMKSLVDDFEKTTIKREKGVAKYNIAEKGYKAGTEKGYKAGELETTFEALQWVVQILDKHLAKYKVGETKKLLDRANELCKIKNPSFEQVEELDNIVDKLQNKAERIIEIGKSISGNTRKDLDSVRAVLNQTELALKEEQARRNDAEADIYEIHTGAVQAGEAYNDERQKRLHAQEVALNENQGRKQAEAQAQGITRTLRKVGAERDKLNSQNAKQAKQLERVSGEAEYAQAVAYEENQGRKQAEAERAQIEENLRQVKADRVKIKKELAKALKANGVLKDKLEILVDEAYNYFIGGVQAGELLEQAEKKALEYALGEYKATKRAEQAEDDRNRAEQDLEEMLAKNNGLEQQVDNIGATASRRKEQLRRETSRADRAENRANNASRDAYDERKKVEALEQQTGEMQDVISSLNASNITAQSEIARLGKLAEGRGGTIKGLKRKVSQIKDEVEYAQDEAYQENQGRKQAEEYSKQAEQDALKHALGEYEATQRAEQAEADRDKAQLAAEEMLAKISNLEKQIEGVQATASGRKEQIRQLTSLSDNIKNALNKVQSESGATESQMQETIENLTRIISNGETVISSLQHQIAGKNAETKEAQDETKEARGKIRELNKQLADVEDDKQKLETDLTYSQRENERLSQENEDLQTGAEEDAYKIQELLRKVDELDEELADRDRNTQTQLSNRDIANELRLLKNLVNKIIAHMDYVSSKNNVEYDEQIEKSWSELDIILTQFADGRLRYKDAKDIEIKRLALEALYKKNSANWPKLPRDYVTKKHVKPIPDSVERLGL